MSASRSPTPAVVPYVHPVDDPALWRSLVAVAGALRFLVVNVHDGPGAVSDPAYEQVLPPLLGAGAPLVGYVDTAYGQVPVEDALAQARVWRSRYGVSGVFLDQVVSAGSDELDALCTGLRALHVEQIVLNPGTLTAPAVLDLGDVVCTYEGTWGEYATLPGRGHEVGDARVAHLVHGVAPGDEQQVVARAAALGASTLAVGSARGTSTWGRVAWPRLTGHGADR